MLQDDDLDTNYVTLDIGGPSVRTSIVIIVVTVSLMMLPMAFLGIPDGFDLMQHMRFAAVYEAAIRSGEIFPNWAAADNFGFGSIGIRYYPPLAYYVLALTKMISGSWFHSFWINTYFWGLLGSVGVYLWIKEWFGARAGMIAAIAYIFLPYRTFQIYQAVLFAEFAASAILPFCFLFLTRLCKHRRWADSIFLAITYALLLLTHIPTAIIATICIAVYAVWIIQWNELRDTLVKGSVAVLLSVFAASFQLIRLVTEVDWVKHNSSQYFATGYYDYNKYLFPLVVSAPSELYTQRILGHFDVMIVLTVILIGLAVVGRMIGNSSQFPARHTRLTTAMTITALFAVFMLSIASSILWNNISILAKIQFPWRWLSVVSIMTAASFGIAAAGLAYRGSKLDRRFVYPLVFIFVALATYDVSQNILPSVPLSEAIFEDKIERMHDEEACDCWWPTWAKKDAFEDREQASAGTRAVDVLTWTATYRHFSVGAGDAANMRVATFYHPHWKALVNGQETTVQSGEDGTIAILLPSEASDVAVTFVEPRSSYVSRTISSITWIGLIVGGFLVIKRKKAA